MLSEIKKSKGFLTKKDGWIDFKEWHAFAWGLMDGFSLKKQSYEKRISAARTFSEDIKKEPHYYRTGYFLTNRGKWIIGTTISLSHTNSILQVIHVCL